MVFAVPLSCRAFAMRMRVHMHMCAGMGLAVGQSGQECKAPRCVSRLADKGTSDTASAMKKAGYTLRQAQHVASRQIYLELWQKVKGTKRYGAYF